MTDRSSNTGISEGLPENQAFFTAPPRKLEASTVHKGEFDAIEIKSVTTSASLSIGTLFLSAGLALGVTVSCQAVPGWSWAFAGLLIAVGVVSLVFGSLSFRGLRKYIRNLQD